MNYSKNSIYLDDMESGWRVEDNYFESTDRCMFIGGGRQNIVRNNTCVRVGTISMHILRAVHHSLATQLVLAHWHIISQVCELQYPGAYRQPWAGLDEVWRGTDIPV